MQGKAVIYGYYWQKWRNRRSKSEKSLLSSCVRPPLICPFRAWVLSLSRTPFVIWHFEKGQKLNFSSFPLFLSVCVFMCVWRCLCTSMFSQRAYEVNNLLSVTQQHMASWRNCGLAICFCWHLSYGASEIHIPCCCFLAIWIYDPKHPALQRAVSDRHVQWISARSEKIVTQQQRCFFHIELGHDVRQFYVS